MIDHFAITVSDFEKSKAFFIKVLAPLGYAPILNMENVISFGIQNGHGKSSDPAGDFWLKQGDPQNPRPHFAFSAASRSVVDAFFKEGISAGATDNGAPGLREKYHPNYYAAFLLDPDGYNIEAVCHRKE